MNEQVSQAINAQINRELYSSYLYFAMSAYLEGQGFKGAGHWMFLQAQEELMHVQKMYQFLVLRGAEVTPEAIDAPPKTWDSIQHVFQEAYKHEQFVTENIHKLLDVALKASDHATANFLQWFVSEQVEEEANTLELVQNLTLAGQDARALLFLDREMGQRVLTPITNA